MIECEGGNENEDDQPEDERMAKMLVELANDVMDCIKMEVDTPSRNQEVGKYLAIMLSEERIKREKFEHVIPKTKTEKGRKPTTAYLCDKKNKDKWKAARTPGSRQKRRMPAIAVSEGVRVCMENHVYCLGDRVFLQLSGGPIGLELTGAVSRPFMARWDRMYLENVERAGMKIILYERYVDDSN